MSADTPAPSDTPTSAEAPTVPYKTLEEAKTYLFAVDGSDPSRHAMNYMMCLVRPGVDKIVLVSVADAAGAEDSEKGRKIAKAVASTMHHYVIQLCERSITVETRVLYTSDSAGKAICDETAREGTNYCMLVLGSRGLGSIKRKILGSVSDYCAKNASVPVLIVQ